MRFRLEMLRVLAQAAAGTGAAPAAPAAPGAAQPPATTTPAKVARIDIRSLPRFNPNLFAARPAMINDLNGLINHINTVMSQLSNGAVTFDTVWKSPAEIGTNYSPTVIHLLALSKWIYNVITIAAPPYALAGLSKFVRDLIGTIQTISFPDRPNLQGELIGYANIIASKIQA